MEDFADGEQEEEQEDEDAEVLEEGDGDLKWEIGFQIRELIDGGKKAEVHGFSNSYRFSEKQCKNDKKHKTDISGGMTTKENTESKQDTLKLLTELLITALELVTDTIGLTEEDHFLLFTMRDGGNYADG